MFNQVKYFREIYLRYKYKLNYLLGLIFLVLSIFFIFGFPQTKTSINNNPIKIDTKLILSKSKQESPIRIVVPSANIDLPIVEANIVNGYWEVSEKSASHGIGSANPKENGNIVIFAHAKKKLFYNLKKVKKENNIYIFTKNGKREYIIKEIKTVLPNQTEVIKRTNKEILTLYTCTGFNDNKRLVVKALPKG